MILPGYQIIHVAMGACLLIPVLEWIKESTTCSYILWYVELWVFLIQLSVLLCYHIIGHVTAPSVL